MTAFLSFVFFRCQFSADIFFHALFDRIRGQHNRVGIGHLKKCVFLSSVIIFIIYRLKEQERFSNGRKNCYNGIVFETQGEIK